MDVGAVIRRVRRQLDLSQRDLAARIGVGQATVARWEAAAVGGQESGEVPKPSMAVMERLVEMAGFELCVLDEHGERVTGLREDAVRTLRGSRYPAHLDVYPKVFEEADRWSRPPSPMVAHRRRQRDRRRAEEGVPSDHPSAVEVAAARSALREQILSSVLAHRRLIQQALRAQLALLDPCSCLIECEEVRGCLPSCPCSCEPTWSDLPGSDRSRQDLREGNWSAVREIGDLRPA